MSEIFLRHVRRREDEVSSTRRRSGSGGGGTTRMIMRGLDDHVARDVGGGSCLVISESEGGIVNDERGGGRGIDVSGR